LPEVHPEVVVVEAVGHLLLGKQQIRHRDLRGMAVLERRLLFLALR